MKSYKYFGLYYYEGGILIESTDEEIVNWATNAIKKRYPSCNVTKYQDGSWKLDKLKGGDKVVGAWLRTQLCLQGWEPFAVTYHARGESFVPPTYHFRFESGD